MTRFLIGIIVISIGLFIKSYYGHIAPKWATTQVSSNLFYILGLGIIFYKIIIKTEDRKDIEFKVSPIKWIFKRPFFIYFLIMIIGIGLFRSGDILNEKLKTNFLASETAETKAILVGFQEQSFLMKYSRKSKNFAILKYRTKDGIITQGVTEKEFEENKQYFKTDSRNKKSTTIIYSKEKPTFFKIKKEK
jgi:hypothetical protein